MFRPRLFRSLRIATLVALAACGGPQDDEAADSAIDTTAGSAVENEVPENESTDVASTDPCAVLDAADVREVTGSDPGLPDKVTPVAGGGSYCNWPMVADTSRTIVTVIVIPAPPVTYDEYLDQTRAVLDGSFDESNYESVAGVGSAAVWAGGFTLQAWGKGHMIQIQSGVGEPALDRDASAELARRALERL